MEKKEDIRIAVVGAGLAGSEAAWFLASKGHKVDLYESKVQNPNPAQKVSTCAELVCTNSLKSLLPEAPHGILKAEMKALGSLILEVGLMHQVPAGDALAVDREKFSQEVTSRLAAHENINLIYEEVKNPQKLKEEHHYSYVILATGPLCTPELTQWVQDYIAGEDLYFYDAIAPVVDADSLDYSKVYFKDRYKEEAEQEADYLNIALNKEEYEKFVEELIKADKVRPKNFEKENFFEACLPIDIMAERGKDTLRFSCMKPVGLETPEGKRAYAVVQLRKENLLGSAYNIVGFQNRLTYPEQKRVFRLLPGLENAQFLHLGSVHRNTFIHSRQHLNFDLSSKKYPWLYFAGQITGVEGYTESASMGLYVSWQIQQILAHSGPRLWPNELAMGALIHYLMTSAKAVPSSINMALFPEVNFKQKIARKDRKKAKRKLIAQRAQECLHQFLGEDS